MNRLTILKSGGYAVHLDVNTPAERLDCLVAFPVDPKELETVANWMKKQGGEVVNQ